MNKDSITTRCMRCGQHNKVLAMVMDASGRGMRCRTCAGLQPAKGVKLTRSVPEEVRREFACSCGFTFFSRREKPLCGYCGSSGVTLRRNKAEDLIKESTHRRYSDGSA